MAETNETTQNDEPQVKDVARASMNDGPGTSVLRGIHNIKISDPADLEDTDMVTIQGVEMSVKFARNEGLLGEVFKGYKTPSELDPELSAGNATASEASKEDAPQKSQTGIKDLDGMLDSLNAEIDAGNMDIEEGRSYEQAAAEIALSNELTVDQAREAFEAVAAGELDVDDIPTEAREMLGRTESAVRETAAKAFEAELGTEAYQWLGQIVAMSPAAEELVNRFVADRAMGRTEGVSISDIYNEISQHYR